MTESDVRGSDRRISLSRHSCSCATACGSPAAPLATTLSTPSVNIGGAAAFVVFSGLTPSYVGLYQVNARVPEAAPSGSAVPVVVTLAGDASNSVAIAVQK